MRVLTGSLAGSTIEWFDFFLYAMAAAIIFDKQFFPTDDPLVSQMLSYLTLALTFFIRPFGGIVFSHIGDKVGRKKTLVITLTMMGAATVAIGLLPTHDQVGVWAPILLIVCRILQGLAIGGEWGGALLLAYEYAPKNRRGFFGSVPQTGVTVGMLLASFSFALVSRLPEEQFTSWGWRLPFIASIVLVLIGLAIRKGLGETPDFEQAQESGDVANIPLVDTLRDHWGSVLIAVGTKVVETAPFYIFATFSVSYAVTALGYERLTMLNAVSLGAFLSSIMIMVMGRISDSIGRKAVFLAGSAATFVFAAPFFMILGQQSTGAAFLAIGIGLAVVWPPVTATLGTLMSETFSVRVRYTGVTLGYQIGAALAGGTAPLIATWMLDAFDGSWHPIAIYVCILAIIGFASAALSPVVVRKESERIAARGDVVSADAA
ncbi:major facilitator transporter [Corynebacterium aquilae DSM 44791]|uniref:Putative proline/betaine transporter n=1 Tax=Corynebacterium aquilae DSM 44791 TaxID=1431546 RepID=A0A1L7CHE7_9CORY|nr:major facilitator transporter [Corynebacterium aquilae DSM 44791]